MAEASLAVSTYYALGWPLSYGDEAMAMIIEALEQDPKCMELLAQYGGDCSVPVKGVKLGSKSWVRLR